MEGHVEDERAPRGRGSIRESLRYFGRAVIGPRVREARTRLDDDEVRNARRLVRSLRRDAPDVVAFGDSNWLFRAGYDTDQRNLGAMVSAELGERLSLQVCAGPGYHPALIRAYVRQIELSEARPTVIVPLCLRMASVAWSTHPIYTYAEAIRRIDGFGPETPVHRMRASLVAPSPADFARYESTLIRTWAGEHSIGELRALIRDPLGHGLDERDRRRLLYAYHHGEQLEPGQRTLLEVEAMGRALRALDTTVVVFETTLPVDEGVALWGEQFRENGEHGLGLMRDAFRRGYDEPIDVLDTGMSFERELFIDPADGSEHLNERGRRRMAGLLAEAARAARSA